jgi:hypothetical protein
MSRRLAALALRPLALAVALAMAFGSLSLLTWPSPADAKNKERYFVVVQGVELAPGVPAPLAEKAKAHLLKDLAGRPEFVTALPKGAPDPAADATKFKKFLLKKKIRAFSILVKLTKYEQTLEPAKEGKTGQVLKVHIDLSLLGSGLPDATMALAGDGSSTVGLEIGNKVRPRDEEVATEDTLRGATASAVDDAVRKLAATPTAKPAKR